MSDGVKPRRRYDSSHRQEQARRTRRSVVQTAHRMFLDRGYAGTTVGAVAAEAGVSAETVYKAFGNKPGLLKAVFDVSVMGDDEPVPMLRRARIQRIREEPDGRRKLSMYGRHRAESSPRSVPVQLLVRAAAASDPGVAGVWDQMLAELLSGMAWFARDLHEEGHLRPDVSVDDARDILWTYSSAELYDLLVIHRGWTPEKYGRWIADSLIAALLPPAPTVTDPRA